jgi:hypothetical protein
MQLLQRSTDNRAIKLEMISGVRLPKISGQTHLNIDEPESG